MTPRWLETVVFVLVALVAIKTTDGLRGTFDVGLDDETVYLDGARYLGVHTLPIAESSPLYPAWYRLLSVFEPDRLRLYFLNWFVLTAALPMALYALARRSGATLAAAAAIAVAWSLSASAMTWPFVTKFAALLLAVGAFAATFPRDRRIGAAITSVTLSLAAYARAELTMFAYVLAAFVGAWGLVSFARRSKPWHTRWPGLVAALFATATAVVLRMHFGDTGTQNRAFFAFAQHYALNLVEDGHLPIDPWTNWHTLSRPAFPTASTVLEAVKENPRAFLWHITRNLKTLPRTLDELFRPLRYVPVPLRNIATLGFDVALATGAFGLFFARRRRPGAIRTWLPLLGLVFASTIASIVVVYPREHYVLPLCFVGTAALASGTGRIAEALSTIAPLRSTMRVGRALLVVALVLLLAALPSFRMGGAPSLVASAIPPPGAWVQQNVHTIHTLRELHLVGRLVILESDYSRGLYADYDYVRVAQWEKASSFRDFVHARAINVIVLDDRLRNDPRFANDPEFRDFVDEREVLDDFVRVPVASTNVVIAVRRALLPASAP